MCGRDEGNVSGHAEQAHVRQPVRRGDLEAGRPHRVEPEAAVAEVGGGRAEASGGVVAGGGHGPDAEERKADHEQRDHRHDQAEMDPAANGDEEQTANHGEDGERRYGEGRGHRHRTRLPGSGRWASGHTSGPTAGAFPAGTASWPRSPCGDRPAPGQT